MNTFINTSRHQRAQSTTSFTPRMSAQFDTHSEIAFNPTQALRSYSPQDLQKLRYKVDLDKQVAEKKERRVREWETKIERDRKYVQHQPFGRHANTALLNKRELEELLTKGRAPSPVLDMPQQLPVNYPITQSINGNSSHRPRTYNSSSFYSNEQNKPPSPERKDSNINPDFQRFYGPLITQNNKNNNNNAQAIPSSGTTAQPIRGDAHDPFLLFDPNKEGQNVFNIIPQQDLYDPWGRPGGGAPLVHHPTGQKFTRYSGSLQDKLNTTGPLGFHRRNYSGNIDEQKRALEQERQRRQQEEFEHRSVAGDTAEWISQLEGSRYPIRAHLPTTQTTREYIGAREPYRPRDSRRLHDALIYQSQERSRAQQISRLQNSLAELQHTEVQNSWWGRGGGGAPTYSTRRHDVANTFENPRQKWTTNHLGQLIMADAEVPSEIKLYDNDGIFPKTSRYSSHRNFYQVPEEKQT